MKKGLPIINRELSWLSFNERVLQEAEDLTVPLIERIKFLGIFSNNRDEFFRVRVGTLKRMVRLGKKAKATVGEEPAILLNKIQKNVIEKEVKFARIYQSLMKELESHNIFMTNEQKLSPSQGKFVREFFHENVMPSLVPVMLNSSPRFPYLKDKSIYLAIKLMRKEKKTRYALIEVPTAVMPRFVVLPEENGKKYIMILDDVIRYCLSDIFSIFDFDVIEAYTIKLTRDAELDIDADISKSLIEKISKSVKKRKIGQPVRFVYDSEMPPDLLNYLMKQIKVINQDGIIAGGRYHNFKDFMNFPDLGNKDLLYKKIQPLPHPDLKQGVSIFKILRKKDVMLHYPYQSFSMVLTMLREASIDPKVTSISLTLYRAAKNSNVVNTLINAVKNGKQVTVVVELQARFDEENNIYWANKLQEEGAKVIFGVPNIKVHSKLFLINRKENGKMVQYAHVGTGNFNESTAKIYTDKSLLTGDKRITAEVQALFDFYEDNLKITTYKNLLVSPFSMRKRWLQLIEKEIHNAKNGKEAFIILKMNSLTDNEMITKLYQASQAGVQIKLIIRGICSLVTDLPGYSENIQAISIVDRFLEHARVFIFCNGGDEKYFISSADWMTRNLDHRSEVAVPIFNKEIQRQMRDIIEIQLRDNTKARLINRKQDNKYKTGNGKFKVRAQEDIYKYLSQENGSAKIPKPEVIEIRSN